MLTAVQGLYENGIVRVKEPVPVSYSKCEVIVTFLPVTYTVEQTKRNDEVLLFDSNLKTETEKNSAIDSLLGICEGAVLTLDDIKAERLARQ